MTTDEVITGYESYVANLRMVPETQRRCVTLAKNSILPRFSIQEIKETDARDIAKVIAANSNKHTQRYLRTYTRVFQDYLNGVDI